MILFRLRSQHTGLTRDFSLKDILAAMADTTNDEIRFPDGNNEEVYNLSSFHDLSSFINTDADPTPPRSAPTRLVNEALPFVNGQREVRLAASPVSICLVFLNGIKQRQGVDYNKQGATLSFLVPLRASIQYDLLEALYDVPA